MSFNNRSWRHRFIVVKMLDKRSSQDWNFPGMCKLRFFFKKNEKEEKFFSHPFFLEQLSSGFSGMRRRLKSARSCKKQMCKINWTLCRRKDERKERGLLPYRVGTSPIFWDPSRAQALSIEPERAQACQYFPGACFEPELVTNKNLKIQARACVELFWKLSLLSLEPGTSLLQAKN